jgi:uncharacterized damage-inducible protein DinB
METAQFQELYRYTRWANLRILTAAEALPEDLFVKPMGSSFPSIRDTLAHILGAEWIWLRRWRGESPAKGIAAEEFPTVQSLRERWNPIAEQQEMFLAGLTAEMLAQPLRYRQLSGAEFEQPLWQVLQHVANHSTYHRGQVATLLRQLGQKPPTVDLIVYHRER